MWIREIWHVILLIVGNSQMISCYQKGSLTYAIDITASMGDDITQVKSNTEQITRIVFDEKSSQIENMVLVTFHDAYTNLMTVSNNSHEFKSKINALLLDGHTPNWDSPEMSMGGTLLALTASLPNSFIYVFTDAPAKDYLKSAKVKELCLKKQSQITYVITDNRWEYEQPGIKVYYDIAATCPGLAMYVRKSQISAIFEPIKDSIKDRKEMIMSRTIPPYTTKDVTFEITDDIEYATATVSGYSVNLLIRGPRHNQTRLAWIESLKVLRLTDLTSGTYTATVWSTSVTSINIFGRTDFSFDHGFSELDAKTLKETVTQPVKDVSTQLFVSVTDVNRTVNIISAKLFDMNEKFISTYDFPLKRISDDFYATPFFVPPKMMFKVAVYGKAVNTERDVTRLSRFPVISKSAGGK